LQDTVPHLVRMLDDPDPDAPFLAKLHGKEVPVVRELVRINHLRNCFLCHAPSHDKRDPMRGVVPIPGKRLPSRYEAFELDRRGGGVFIRADVTYLRQDFSVMQPVKDHGLWPKEQRYDYLVRQRPLADAERVAWEARKGQGKAEPLSAYKRAILYALCG